MLKVLNNGLIRAKAAFVLKLAAEAVPKNENRYESSNERDRRAEWLSENWGLETSYVNRVSRGVYKEPSVRVLNNLGIELWVRDIHSGLMQKIEMVGQCEIDHYRPESPNSLAPLEISPSLLFSGSESSQEQSPDSPTQP